MGRKTNEVLATQRLGESLTMHCGMRATIITYRNASDIDVLFTDGTIVQHQLYDFFKKGNISNPNAKIGEVLTMGSGERATIIAARNLLDIDIQFSDGSILKNKTYAAFRNGKLYSPNFYLGTMNTMNCGMGATIIAYRNASDIDVQFTDGTIVKNRTLGDFKKGAITNPNVKPHLGEIRIMNCGMKATVIEYRKCNDIDIQFADGVVVQHKSYQTFRNGGIKHPNTKVANLQKHIGKTNQMYYGQSCTIVAIRSLNDIDVKFNDGTLVCGKSYCNFYSGEIMNPNVKVGESRIMKCGQKATIITWRSMYDVDVQFEDGTIVSHRTYSHFQLKNIFNPSLYIGETRTMNCGVEATIIAFKNCSDINVKFEDGLVLEHKSYELFKKGSIKHPATKKIKE